jgi:hypothetical protein
MANYQVDNQWGGPSAPWVPGGQWQLGDRSSQYVTEINITSNDDGNTFEGTMTYSGEEPIGFRATNQDGNVYSVENQWGGTSAPWNPGGEWVIGARDNQKVIQLSAIADGSQNLNGTMTYQGEQSIGFKAAPIN